MSMISFTVPQLNQRTKIRKGIVLSGTGGDNDHGKMICHLSDVSKLKLFIKAD